MQGVLSTQGAQIPRHFVVTTACCGRPRLAPAPPGTTSGTGPGIIQKSLNRESAPGDGQFQPIQIPRRAGEEEPPCHLLRAMEVALAQHPGYPVPPAAAVLARYLGHYLRTSSLKRSGGIKAVKQFSGD